MLSRYRITFCLDGRYRIEKRKWIILWVELEGSYPIKSFAENEIVQKLRNDEKELNTKVKMSK